MKTKIIGFVRKNKKNLLMCAAALGLILANLGAGAALRANPQTAEKVFVPVAKAVSNVLRRVINLLPFSFTEILAIMLCGMILLLLISILAESAVIFTRFIKRRFFSKTDLKPPVQEEPAADNVKMVAVLLTAVACLFIFFNFSYGFVFSRPTIDELLGLNKTQHSAQQLYDISLELALKAEAAREQTGSVDPASFNFDFNEIRLATSDAFIAMQQKNTVFEGMIARPKPVIFSRVMSELGVSGVYSPFFSESSISKDGIAASLPFTIAHEIAHGVMFGREDEANFVAFLVTVKSNDPLITYSGYFRAFTYCSSALYGADRELYIKLMKSIPPDVYNDRRTEVLHYQKYQGRLNSISEKFNDTFIKATGQKDGIESYGNVVDLILAYYDLPTDSALRN